LRQRWSYGRGPDKNSGANQCEFHLVPLGWSR
jgi:hypothetical protein